MYQHTLYMLVSIPAASSNLILKLCIKKQYEILTFTQVKPIRAVGNISIDSLIQVVSRHTGHALVTVASSTVFTTG